VLFGENLETVAQATCQNLLQFYGGRTNDNKQALHDKRAARRRKARTHEKVEHVRTPGREGCITPQDNSPL